MDGDGEPVTTSSELETHSISAQWSFTFVAWQMIRFVLLTAWTIGLAFVLWMVALFTYTVLNFRGSW